MNSRIILIGRNAAFPTLSGARFDGSAMLDAARSSSSSIKRAAPLTCGPASLLPRQLAARKSAASFIVSFGMTPDAVAPADQGCRDEHTRPELTAAPGGVPTPSSPGDFLEKLQDVVTVISGMIVFGGIAFFLLVLA